MLYIITYQSPGEAAVEMKTQVNEAVIQESNSE